MTDAAALSASCMCGVGRFERVFLYDAPPAGEVRFSFSGSDDYRREVLRCTVCGHFLSVHEMDDSALYDADYVSSTYRGGIRAAFERVNALPPERSDNVARVQRVLAFAERHVSGPRRGGRPPRVLDVGSGLCVFLHRMKEAGWDATAMDHDPRQVAHARDVVGVRAVCADLLDAPDLGCFDLITFNKVLEHVRGPVALLAAAARYLSPGGALYIEVPDGEIAVRDGPTREEFFIEHHHVFSAASVGLLASRAGYVVRELERLQEPSTKYTLRVFLARGQAGTISDHRLGA